MRNDQRGTKIMVLFALVLLVALVGAILTDDGSEPAPLYTCEEPPCVRVPE